MDSNALAKAPKFVGVQSIPCLLVVRVFAELAVLQCFSGGMVQDRKRQFDLYDLLCVGVVAILVLNW